MKTSSGSLAYGSLAHHIGSVMPGFVIAGVLFVGYGYVLFKVMPDLRPLAHRVLSEDESS